MKDGILVISHGSNDERWVALVDEAVAGVKPPEEVMPIVSSFLEIVEGRLIQDGIDKLEAEGVTDIFVVPLFVSSGSTHVHEISYALGVTKELRTESDLEPFRVQANVHFGVPIDDDSYIAEILFEKLSELSEKPEEEVIVLVGHGSAEPGFYERWSEGLEQLGRRLQSLGRFAAMDTATLLPDQAAERVRAWNEAKPHWRVIVAPLFLSEGYFTNKVIPKRLEGLDYRYNGKALLPHPLVSRWMERQIGLWTTMRNGDLPG